MLWEDAINIFDQFIKEETPLDKLQVVLRTMKVITLDLTYFSRYVLTYTTWQA